MGQAQVFVETRSAHPNHIILSSGVIVALGPPVALCTFIAVFVAALNQTVLNGRMPHWVPLLQVTSLPFTLTSPVLALLLVFRTNASYGRFDEARKAWGSNVNRTRDLARQALTWIRSPADTHKLHCLLRHIKAYSFCLKDHLIEENTLREELIGILEPRELESVMSAHHHPNYVVQVMSELITRCQIRDWEKIAMDHNITQFHDNVGGCERLFKTPIPFAYTRLTSRFLILWHMAIPLALWSSCGWLTIPVTFMSAAALFYIEEVGVLIEEPFWILALLSISTGITSALDGISAAHKEASLLTCSTHDPPSNHDHLVITLKPTSDFVNTATSM